MDFEKNRLVRRTNTFIYRKNLSVKIIGSLKHLPIEATLAIILQGGQNLVSVGNFEITGKCFRIKNLPRKVVVKINSELATKKEDANKIYRLVLLPIGEYVPTYLY